MKIKIVFIVLVAIIATAAIFIITNKNESTAQQNESVQLPETVFDVTITVPGTRLAFYYPGNGFYGLGAKVVKDETERSVGLEPESPYVAEKGSQFVILRIGVHDFSSEHTSLKDFIDATYSNSIVGSYVKENGEYREINGIRFFLAQVDEDATVWYAWTLIDNEVVEITLSYTPSIGIESEAALLHNDQLFLQILDTVRLQ